ncbi:hypothetical protein HXX76_002552 [Chlamydomonas incerta]|uniref:Uncharacterized protein n=1 Tax=Chlamydomonas incerta TaxID=51695 RepID=A0A835W9U2_CHLIN|nr:hypothetical protein HXX76_002552 [Chlamydomonas incerta]|eukprot:KAG2442466.1 hypothetical protein HXX76_002552 [Chlamydomonas incerta]
MMRPGSTRPPVARGGALQRDCALPPAAIRAARIGSISSCISSVRGARAAAAGAAAGDAPTSQATEGPTAVGRQGTEALSELRQLRAAVEQLGATAAELRAGQDALLQELAAQRQELAAQRQERAAQRAAAAKEARAARLQRAQALVDSRLVAGSDSDPVDEAVADALAKLLRGSTQFEDLSDHPILTQVELEKLTGLRFRNEQRPADGEAGGQERTWLILEDDPGC